MSIIDDVKVTVLREIVDPLNPGQKWLLIGGTVGKDRIELKRGNADGIVKLVLEEKDFPTPKLVHWCFSCVRYRLKMAGSKSGH